MILRLIEEVIAAAVGTMAFALMFHVPRQYSFCEGSQEEPDGWSTGHWSFMWILLWALSVPALFTVVFLSRIFAVRKKCPVTMFLIPGIFPLVPGNGDLSDGTGPGGKRLGSGGRQGIDLYQVCSCHCRRDPSRF